MDKLLNDVIPRIVILVMTISTVGSIEQDVCLWNTFDANCAENEVIQMYHAHYGRMSVGSCIPKKAGYEMGCQEDVLGYLDSVCSGRQSCQLTLPDYLTKKNQPCPLGLTSYLQVQYNCLRVNVSPNVCTGDHQLVQGTHGLLANVITEQTGQGSPECPWMVRGNPGQKIRLTLHDYGVWTTLKGEAVGREVGVRLPERSDICHIYARVTEDSTMRSITLCGGEMREKIVYLSETESLQIALTNPKHTERAAYFLLQYDILGCPDYSPPNGVVVARHGNNILVKCPTTGEEWRLSCEGTRWISKNDITNCTESGGPSMTIGTLVNSVLTLPQWILILMILAVAVIIAVPIIVIGCVSLRRNRDSVIASGSNLQMDTRTCIPYSGLSAKERDSMLAKNDRSQTFLRGREYTTTVHRNLAVRPSAGPLGGEMPPLPLPPTTSMPDAEDCIAHGTLGHNRNSQDICHGTFIRPYIEHKYESPIAIRRTHSDSDNTGTCYNELGPNHNNFLTAAPCDHAESDTEMLGSDQVESILPE